MTDTTRAPGPGQDPSASKPSGVSVVVVDDPYHPVTPDVPLAPRRQPDVAPPSESSTCRRPSRPARLRRRVRERDGDECWLCGLTMEFVEGLRAQQPRDATLDHVVPLSKGGTNALANLRLAHFTCNTHRGNEDPPS
jgi:5-methylcytosine-specific restriction endonuclease McrA